MRLTLSRNHLARSLMAAALGLGLSAGAAHAQEGEPIRLGAIYIMSGTASVYGQFARQGLELAIDEVNEAGGIMGRPVEYVLQDSQIKADVAIQAARKLAYQDQVDALLGLDSSGVAAGIVPTIPSLGKPLIITHAATPDVTGKLCNRNTFRISVNIVQNNTAAARLAAETDAKRWTTIGPDYAFGHQSWEFFGEQLKALKSDVELMDETAFPRFGNEDYTPFINSVMASEPDGVLISLWGGDLVNFVRQANNLGFFDKGFEVMMTVGAATEVLSALGEEMPEGVWLSTRYWFEAYDNPMNKKFVEAYAERYKNPPSYNAEGAYAAVYVYKAAIERAGSADADAIIDALAGMTVMTPMGEITVREGDHQAVVGPTWGKTAGMNDKYGIRKLDPVHTYRGEEVTPPVSETGCKLES